jgi:hypothetical protein
MKITNVLQLKPQFEDYTIFNPVNGEEFVFRLRPLKPAELSELRAAVHKPKPPQIGFVSNPQTGAAMKDDYGQPIPKYDEENPEYVKALGKSNEDFVYAWLLACWEAEVPGETPAEKLQALRDNVPNWVFIELQTKLQEIQGYRTSDIAYQKKKLAQTISATSNTNSVK